MLFETQALNTSDDNLTYESGRRWIIVTRFISLQREVEKIEQGSEEVETQIS